MEKFTKTVRKGSVRPSNPNLEPLTVVEFSLVPEVKAELMRALEPFIKGETKDKALLAKIMNDTMPPEVMADMKSLGHRNDDAHTVYVVKNLPSFKDETNPKLTNTKQKVEEATHVWRNTPNYGHLMAKGVALALGLEPGVPIEMFRAAHDHSTYANKLHKHEENVTMLSVSKPDGSVTRFTDMLTLSEDPHAAQVQVVASNAAGNRDDLASLNQMHAPHPHEKDIVPLSNVSNEQHYNLALDKHSLDVKTDYGDLVLWP
ncbi:MAG: hypothetical protein K2Q01_08615, partial [Rickettsiales bacterium]|nr:hypothetical protein [Rickettsiales bacterium]